MADENTQTNETSETVTQTETVVEKEPTLEDVYKSAGVDSAPEQPQRQPQQPQQNVQQPQYQTQQPATPSIPDPYDTDAHKAYLANLAQGQTTLSQGLNAVATFLTQQQQAIAEAKIKTDIAKAVEIVNEGIGAKPTVIEAMIDAKAREPDQRFKKLWLRRDTNPTAWNNALNAVKREIANDFQLKVDPALQAAQRARKTAQSAMATTKEEAPDAKWEGLSQSDFATNWERMKEGNQN